VSLHETDKRRQHELDDEAEAYDLLNDITNGNHVREMPDVGTVHNKKSRNGDEHDAVHNVADRSL
jgi:hypothetical protein